MAGIRVDIDAAGAEEGARRYHAATERIIRDAQILNSAMDGSASQAEDLTQALDELATSGGDLDISLGAVGQSTTKLGTPMGAASRGTKQLSKDVSEGARAIGLLTKALGALATVAGITSFIHFAESIEISIVRLKAVTGSLDAASRKFDELFKIVEKTPFAVPQVLEAWEQLARRGINATNEELTALADLAVVAGMSMDDLARAISTRSLVSLRQYIRLSTDAREEMRSSRDIFKEVVAQAGQFAGAAEEATSGYNKFVTQVRSTFGLVAVGGGIEGLDVFFEELTLLLKDMDPWAKSVGHSLEALGAALRDVVSAIRELDVSKLTAVTGAAIAGARLGAATGIPGAPAAGAVVGVVTQSLAEKMAADPDFQKRLIEDLGAGYSGMVGGVPGLPPRLMAPPALYGLGGAEPAWNQEAGTFGPLPGLGGPGYKGGPVLPPYRDEHLDAIIRNIDAAGATARLNLKIMEDAFGGLTAETVRTAASAIGASDAERVLTERHGELWNAVVRLNKTNLDVQVAKVAEQTALTEIKLKLMNEGFAITGKGIDEVSGSTKVFAEETVNMAVSQLGAIQAQKVLNEGHGEMYDALVRLNSANQAILDQNMANEAAKTANQTEKLVDELKDLNISMADTIRGLIDQAGIVQAEAPWMVGGGGLPKGAVQGAIKSGFAKDFTEFQILLQQGDPLLKSYLTYFEALQETTLFYEETEQKLNDLSDAFSTGLTDALFQTVTAAETAEEAFRSFGMAMLEMAAKMAMQSAIETGGGLLMKVLKSVSGGGWMTGVSSSGPDIVGPGTVAGNFSAIAQHGLDFTVPGHGGPDSARLNMRVTPGERITAIPPGRAPEGKTTVNVHNYAGDRVNVEDIITRRRGQDVEIDMRVEAAMARSNTLKGPGTQSTAHTYGLDRRGRTR